MEERALREPSRSSCSARTSSGARRRSRTASATSSQQAEELKQAKRVQRRELERISGPERRAGQAAAARRRRAGGAPPGGAEIRADRGGGQSARASAAPGTSSPSPCSAWPRSTPARRPRALVELPNDEMKGRIIGRDGRNIRALEKLTGVDVIIDETPSAVVLSSFDGVRREIARLTLERLIADGRIHPALIEETYEQAKRERRRARSSRRASGRRSRRTSTGSTPSSSQLLGQLRFRTSYGQNVLDHLVECANLAGDHRRGARRVGRDRAPGARSSTTSARPSRTRSRARMPLIGARIARRHGESEAVAHAMEAHHNEVEPKTVEAVIVQAADAVSGARPGARGDSLEQYVGRLRDLEEIAARHHGRRARLRDAGGPRDPRGGRPGHRRRRRARRVISHEIATAIEKEVELPGPDQDHRDPREPRDRVRG